MLWAHFNKIHLCFFFSVYVSWEFNCRLSFDTRSWTQRGWLGAWMDVYQKGGHTEKYGEVERTGERGKKKSQHTRKLGKLMNWCWVKRRQWARGTAAVEGGWRGPKERQAQKAGGYKGGLGSVFLAHWVEEGGIFSRGFSRGVYLEAGCVKRQRENRRDVHCTLRPAWCKSLQ